MPREKVWETARDEWLIQETWNEQHEVYWRDEKISQGQDNDQETVIVKKWRWNKDKDNVKDDNTDNHRYGKRDNDRNIDRDNNKANECLNCSAICFNQTFHGAFIGVH